MYLARLGAGILFGVAIMILEAFIFLMNKTKQFLEKLFYNLLEETEL